MLPTSRELGEQLLEIAKPTGIATLLMLAHRAFATSVFLQGDLEACRTHTEAGLALYDIREHGTLAIRAGTDPGVAHGVYNAWALWILGYPQQSLRRIQEALDLAKQVAHSATIAFALCYAAVIRNLRGEHAEAKALSDEAIELSTEKKFALWLAWASMDRGWALAGLLARDEGIPLMREGIKGWTKTGARAGLTFFPVTLAEICLHAGRLQEAALLLDEATPIIKDNDEHFYEPEMLRLKGELALRQSQDGAEDAAMEYFCRGLEFARAQGSKAWELRLVMSQSRLFAKQGNRTRALNDLCGVYGWFTEGHNTADLRAASVLIESLKGDPARIDLK
jgi:adenylate cyclase